ncbi:hypothetical protein ABVT39_004171, partial [Epinephelus coioides]
LISVRIVSISLKSNLTAAALPGPFSASLTLRWSSRLVYELSRDCGSASDRCLQLGVKKDTGNSSGFSVHRALIRIF